MKQSFDLQTPVNINLKSQWIIPFAGGKQKKVSMDWTQVVPAATRVLKEKFHPAWTIYSNYNLG